MMPRNDQTGEWETYGGTVSSGGGRPQPTEQTRKGGRK
jgi:hypothetical protein